MHGKQLVKSNVFFEKEEEIISLDKKKRKKSIILLQKELEKLKNYIIMLIFKIWYINLKGPVKMWILLI